MMKKGIMWIGMALTAITVSAQQVVEWRGVNRTGTYNDSGLLKSWAAEGPTLLWSLDGIGEGYSQLGIAGDKIYVTGMKGTNHMGYVSVIDMNGKLLQQKPYSQEWVGNYSGARAAVTLNDGKLYQYSGHGVLTCMDATSLNVIWQKNILKEFGADELEYGMNEAPLIIGDKLIITPGGKTHNVVALNKQNGAQIWTSKAKGESSAYCSPIYISDMEVPIVATITEHSIIGLNADNEQLLWSYPFPSRWTEQCNSPIYENGMLYCMTGNGYGSVMLKLENGGRSISKAWDSKELTNVFSAMVKVGHYIYGCNESRNWVCLDWNTGTLMHKTRSRQSVPVAADGMIYNYCDNGEVQLIQPHNAKMEIVSRFRVTKGTEQHWAHPVVHKGVLYIRHGDSLMAYKVK